ncbi:MAG: hypothetical protein JRI86_14520 [Deltaproteobacteria bacterium]|nr:hypothetical protein [Deltaproteobacteria bacterium]
MESKEPKYFASPREAVKIISELLIKEDWKTLSRHYYLEGSNIDVEELESGRFFIRTKPPEVRHPGGFWVYKHPFDPSFEYLGHKEIRDNIIIVTVHIRIDEGMGMFQEGREFFAMGKTPKGLQVLPRIVDSEETFGNLPEPTMSLEDLLKGREDW